MLLDGPFDERMIGAEDWDLLIRLAAIGCRFGALNALTCRYRIHPGNKSSPYSPLAEKRKQARIYSRFKVMKSDWFNAISPAAQYKFFYEVLIDHLSGDSLRQEEMIASDAFSSLSDHVQAHSCIMLQLITSSTPMRRILACPSHVGSHSQKAFTPEILVWVDRAPLQCKASALHDSYAPLLQQSRRTQPNFHTLCALGWGLRRNCC